ncbi:MAG: hypothetical protein FWF66_03540 [Candidatus Bathyarchaeota archaeon]|nr:hypothetical protein [Candidatus Termiticorpusculum sp.]MCL1970514.1 hypothetical protein [Candidatus Termiticorpusculum sp.]
MRKPKMGNIVLLIILLIVILAVSLSVVNVFQNSHDEVSDAPQLSPPNTPSNAQLNNAGYLAHRDDGESKLFLVSANASYGVYSANMFWGGGTFVGQDCFAITAKIRSDYTLEELQKFSVYSDGYHSGNVYFAVRVTLYDGASQVSASDVSGAIVGSMSPPLGVPQWDLSYGETGTVEIYLATNSRNIDNYSIDLRIIELSGLPIP